MKTCNLIILLLIATICNAQKDGIPVPASTGVRLEPAMEFSGLSSTTYMYVGSNGNPINKNGYISIVWNSRFCRLSIDNRVEYFNVDASYTRMLEKGEVVESFINDEGSTMPRGYYSIMIAHKKSGVNELTINLPMQPGGTAYLVPNAQAFSQNGQVKGNVYVTNWKEIEAKAHIADSIRTVKKKLEAIEAEKKRVNDSLERVKAAEMAQADLENGKTYYRTDEAAFKHQQDRIDTAFSAAVGANYASGSVKVYISREGVLDSVATAEAMRTRLSAYINKLQDILKTGKYKVPPYKHTDGKNYPSCCKLTLLTTPQLYEDRTGINPYAAKPADNNNNQNNQNKGNNAVQKLKSLNPFK